MNVQKYLNSGYTIDHESDTYITLSKKKSISFMEGFLIIIGFPLLFLFGAGLLCWLLAILNYLIRNNETITISKIDKV